jgi:3-deoxy-D-manno-octulosonic-acid transferase
VILLDTIGELAGAYRLATVVFVGGSLVPRGGHNVIEPAAFAKPIVVGPYAENFADVVSDFLAAEALVQVKASPDRVLDSLTEELAGLLRDSERAKLTGARARAILDRNRGATECTVAAIMNAIRDTCRS